jgi:hypothetical protein
VRVLNRFPIHSFWEWKSTVTFLSLLGEIVHCVLTFHDQKIWARSSLTSATHFVFSLLPFFIMVWQRGPDFPFLQRTKRFCLLFYILGSTRILEFDIEYCALSGQQNTDFLLLFLMFSPELVDFSPSVYIVFVISCSYDFFKFHSIELIAFKHKNFGNGFKQSISTNSEGGLFEFH